MDAITVDVRRGDVVEARHRVHAVALVDGKVALSRGNPELPTLFRSAAKPIQVLPIVRARPDLDDAEIAVASASHGHHPDQIEPVLTILAKAAATDDDLECGSETPLEHTCSGKHAAMLLLCRERGWPIEGYRLASHPCQQELLSEVANAAEVEASCLPTAIDGCGVVTYALTLERMACSFSRLEATTAGRRVADSMRARPELISGDVRVDTDLMQLGRGWAAKYGAEGLLCAVSDGLGIAMKVEDGAPRALRPALAAFVDQLGLESGALADAPIMNSRGEVVGEHRVTG